MAVGVALMLVAWTVLVLQVLNVFPKSFVLSISAFSMSLVGFTMGMGGLVQVIRVSKRKREQEGQ